MKSEWQAVVNAKTVLDRFLETFQPVNVAYVSVDGCEAQAQQFEDATKQYEQCRDKVSEILVLRAMARPLASDTTREKLCKEAKDKVDGLRGVLPVVVSLMLNDILNESLNQG